MTGPVALPPPLRVSDAERDRALRILREASVSGRLSDDSFEWRVDAALRSRNREELRSVVDDLLTDLGSTNGTRLNGWRLVAPHVVRPGDQVTFGLVSVVITRSMSRW